MAKLYPNSKLLILLTSVDMTTGEERLLFIHSKVISDFEDGDNVTTLQGHAQCFLINKSKVYQTCLIGCEDIIDKIFDQCLCAGEIHYSNRDRNVRTLNISIPQLKDPVKRDGYHNESSLCYEAIEGGYIPEFMQNSDTLDALTGYKEINGITPLVPPGVYDKGWLLSLIRSGYVAVKEERRPFVDFHGDRSTAVYGEGCHDLVGFVQSPVRRQGDKCTLLNNEHDTELAYGEIDPATGLFRLSSSDPVKCGCLKIEVAGMENEINFSLLVGADFNINVANNKIIDLFCNELWLGEKRNRPARFEDVTWFETSYNDINVAASNLSDIFVNVLAPLGRDILIVDPYFMGDIKESDGALELSYTQKAFVNALVTVAVKYGLDSVTIVGNSRSGNHTKRSDEEATATDAMISRYKRFWQGFFGQSLFKSINPWKVTFKRSSSDFHNRYWFYGTPQGTISGERGIIVSNSLSGMIEADFCNIVVRTHFDMVTSRYAEIVNNSNTLLEI
ncbi:MAG: hypothetical protein K2L97_05380 [Muribaculaceae bacterium]|nr:hypothetical protein [Muribaculaceae bacterium]